MIRYEVPTCCFFAKVSDFLWMVQCSLSNNIPICIGWQSTYFTNKSLINRIFYILQINESATSVALITETMKRAQKAAEENRKQEMCEKKPTFDQIFVAFGGFHIEIVEFVRGS